MRAPILYVEDEEDYQILVKRILARAGLAVRTTETGREAMQILQTMRPSLLILDIALPDTDGYALCSTLRKDPAWIDLPILMLTVRRRPDEWLCGFSCGANDYVSKPLNPPELVERVVRCLEGKTGRSDSSHSAEFNLIQAAVAGNRAAFEVLRQKYRGRLAESLGVLVHNDAHLEDVVSHAFATAYEKLGEFRGEASFFTWIYRIALSESVVVYRKPIAMSLEDLTGGEENYLLARNADLKSLETTLVDRDVRRQALEALDLVPKLYREVLEMYFLQDLPYDRIARRLRVPMGTVMSRLHKARKLLQVAWQHRHASITLVK